jgi:hypothetical protein
MLCSVTGTTTLDREWVTKVQQLLNLFQISRNFRHHILLSKNNVLKIVLIIVNINKDENKSLISNQFSVKSDFSPTSWRTILRR